MEYYDIITVKSINGFIVAFNIKTMNSETQHISIKMMKIVDIHGYHLHDIKIEELMLHTLSIKKGFDLTKTDIPKFIVNRYIKENRQLKLQKLTE